MASGRIIRVNELLKREIAADILRLFSNSRFDTGSITVTRVETAPDLRDANVSISIFGHEEERTEMIRFLNHHRKEVQARLSKNVKIKYTPRLHFKHDSSLEDGDRVLGILESLDIPDEEDTPDA
ncbi:30S ribosome-binding factor RbfA [Tichowtungia aerotolerans]|uniref:Ribosome-binding factor A n=1 Tax=Tichowtungia aerotolerans TaxID=2697043 RepID=A0A6P1M306_9BACT|nr:30S ribosome-binding factor RbfA [Tichowtungia aerotolerans]QHI68217.1 30S ribosome-binding factor RbfA [Tichowtungia aerotolerans]